MSEINNGSLILCVNDRNEWKEVQNESKLDWYKKDIIEKAIEKDRKVHFFRIDNYRVVGESTIISKDRDIISFKPLLIYSNSEELTPDKLRNNGVNFKFDRNKGYKNSCSGKKLITKTESDKISEIGMSENK